MARAECAPKIADLPASLLDSPLDYILADHDRHRGICQRLREIARLGHIQGDEVASLSTYLTTGLTQHHDDEDEILFPALRRRALPEDELESVLSRLEDDHQRSHALVKSILDFFESAGPAQNVPVPQHLIAVILRYSAREYRHLAIENAVVMTIAQVRLTKSDLAAMSRQMKARRGMVN